MARIESIDEALFTPLANDVAEKVEGGAATAATYERYEDYGPNGEFIGYSYVQVDGTAVRI